jgi:amino acid transporter
VDFQKYLPDFLKKEEPDPIPPDPYAIGLSPTARFGTFAGVFTPNVLTILGIIFFLRTGWVVGQAGLTGALIIVGIANCISLLTGLSLSAIATNMNVKAGGNYFIISRTLGLEIGGAIGIPLYLSQAISIAFYIIGFTEALQTIAYFQAFDPRLIAGMTALIFGVIGWVGADFALRIQFFILAILMAAVVSFFSGGWDAFVPVNYQPNYTDGVSFWIVFAVFFPAVTGIEVGTSMSGDLKDPGRSIPRGTIASILFTAVIYMFAVYWLASHATSFELIDNNLIMTNIARWSPLIMAGVLAATLSSALGSIMAAPRTLQAIANDDVVPRQIASNLGSPTEPRMAVLISTGIALAIIMMGDLNFVAPIITMFFLNTYGMTNLVAAFERMVGNPSFRPRFNIHWSVSLLGAIGCYAAMFLINATATVVAVVISYGIYFYIKRKSTERTWGDLRSGIWFSLARRALLQLEEQRYHVKNWRPNLLVFTGQPHNREQLTHLAEWLSYGQGVVTFFQLLVGDVDKLAGHGLREIARKQIRTYIHDRHMAAFAEAEVVDDFKTGAITVSQAHGLGGLESNAILMGWSRTPKGRQTQFEIMSTLHRFQKSVLLLKHATFRQFGRYKVIDVWWRGRGPNADLMLLLAHIINQHPRWHDARIRLLRIIKGEQGREDTLRHMKALLKQVRVSAEPIVIVQDHGLPPTNEILVEWSNEADLTIMGLNIPDEADLAAYAERMDETIARMGSVLLVRSGTGAELLETD